MDEIRNSEEWQAIRKTIHAAADLAAEYFFRLTSAHELTRAEALALTLVFVKSYKENYDNQC